MKINKSYIFSIVFIYLLILIPSLNTPFQSDDYSYFLQGIDLTARWKHYMGWSGRIVNDFTSSFLLSQLPYVVYEAIHALIFVLMCMFVSMIPAFISQNGESEKLSPYILWTIFIAYWIANPNLGQTSFWIVGAANYLWPIMWAGFYITYLLYLTNIKEKLSYKNYFLIGVLGFLAGCSNENTSVSIVLFSLIVFFIERHKKLIALGGISSFIGTLILILAPGNAVRKQYFLNWYDKSTLEQLLIHVLERMPGAITAYLHIYLMIIVAIILMVILNQKINRKKVVYCLIFFILSVFSNLVLAKSPYIGGRNLNTGLFFLLPVLAIILSECTCQFKKYALYAKALILTYGMLFFIPSYTLFNYMMKQAALQHKVRENIILEGKKAGKREFDIPDWYFTKLLKHSDKFDTYRSGAMKGYYGVDKINWTPVNFNYAALYVDDKYVLDKKLIDDLVLITIYEHQADTPFRKRKQLLLEFNQSVSNYIKNGDKTLYIHLYYKGDSKFVNVDQPLNREVKIGEKFYFNIPPQKRPLEELSHINFGFYNPANKTNSQDFNIVL